MFPEAFSATRSNPGFVPCTLPGAAAAVATLFCIAPLLVRLLRSFASCMTQWMSRRTSLRVNRPSATGVQFALARAGLCAAKGTRLGAAREVAVVSMQLSDPGLMREVGDHVSQRALPARHWQAEGLLRSRARRCLHAEPLKTSRRT
jgi:hypothetical protein